MSVKTVSYLQKAPDGDNWLDPVPMKPKALEKVRRVQKEIAESVSSSHDILPHAESGTIHDENWEEIYQKFGHRAIRWTQYTLKTDRIRLACEEAAGFLFQTGKIGSGAGLSLAVTKFGVGECSELSKLAWARLAHLNPHLVYIANTKNARKPEDGSLAENHAFLLLGVSGEEEFHYEPGCQIKKILNIFKKGSSWIYDPLFHILCSTSKYETEARELIRYIDRFKTLYFVQCQQFSVLTLPQGAEAVRDAEIIYEKAKTLLPNVMPNDDLKLLASKVATSLENDVVPKVTKVLGEQFPKIAWKSKVDAETIEWTLWTRGNENDLAAVGDKLKQIGAKVSADMVKKSDKYAVILKDPDPVGLHNLFERYTPYLIKLLSAHVQRGIAQQITAYAG